MRFTTLFYLSFFLFFFFSALYRLFLPVPKPGFTHVHDPRPEHRCAKRRRRDSAGRLPGAFVLSFVRPSMILYRIEADSWLVGLYDIIIDNRGNDLMDAAMNDRSCWPDYR